MATVCWSSFTRCVLPGSPQRPPACFAHHITCQTPAFICTGHPSSKGVRQKFSLSVSLFLVLTKILTTKILSYLRIVRKEIRQYLQITQNPLQCSHLQLPIGIIQGTLKILIPGFPPEIPIYWPGMWPGHSFPHGSNGRPAPTFRGSKLLSMKPQVLLQCQPPNTNFLLLTSVVINAHRLFFWEVGNYSKSIQNPINELKKKVKVCSGFYHSFFPPI